MFYIISVSILIFLFSFIYTPVSLGISLFLTRVFVVFLIRIFLCSWYRYILFLVYIGGMLVLFIYMCVISSNVKFYFKTHSGLFILIFLVYLISENFWSDRTISSLGYSSYERSYLINISLFLRLTIILLFTFLSVIRIVEIKKPLLVN